MKGTLNRVKLGFFAIALLLLMVGTASYLEFRHLNETMGVVATERQQRNALTEQLLTAVYQQSVNVSDYFLTDSLEVFVRRTARTMAEMDDAARRLNQYDIHVSEISKIRMDIENYSKATEAKFIDETTSVWGRDGWYHLYLSKAERDLAASTQTLLHQSNTEMSENAMEQLNKIYRSDLSILITLVACMFLLFIFYSILKAYYFSPVVNIEKGLKAHLTGDKRYDVKEEGAGEIKTLNSLIKQLIQNSESSEEE